MVSCSFLSSNLHTSLGVSLFAILSLFSEDFSAVSMFDSLFSIHHLSFNLVMLWWNKATFAIIKGNISCCYDEMKQRNDSEFRNQ